MFCKMSVTFGGNIKVELGLSYYTTKPDVKGAADINTPILAIKPDVAS